MADRYFNQFQGTLEKGVVRLYFKVTFDNTNECSLSTADSKGVASFARHASDTGKWLLTLQDSYRKVLGIGSVFSHDDAAANVAGVYIESTTINTTDKGKTAHLVTQGWDGAAADPAATVVGRFWIELSNSSAL